MAETIELFITKKKPSEGLYKDDDGLFVGKEYLYTTSGNTQRWWIAMNMVFKKNEIPPKSIIIKIEEVEKNGKEQN